MQFTCHVNLAQFIFLALKTELFPQNAVGIIDESTAHYAPEQINDKERLKL